MKKSGFYLKQVKKITKPLLVFFVFLIFFTNCSEKQRIDTKTLAKVYTELLVNNELYRNNPDTLSVLKSQILENYNLTEKEYLRQFKELDDNQELWKQFFKEAKVYLDSLKKNLNPEKKKGGA